VFETDVEGYAGVSLAMDENLFEFEFTRLTPEAAQRFEDEALLYELGQGPHPLAVCIEPEEVNEDNEHRNCAHCKAGVLFEGYDYAGEFYFFTIDCFKAFSTATSDKEMQEWLSKYDAGTLDDDDLEYVYWTNWEGE
jgi:hypothetical protein